MYDKHFFSFSFKLFIQEELDFFYSKVYLFLFCNQNKTVDKDKILFFLMVDIYKCCLQKICFFIFLTNNLSGSRG